MEKPTDKYTWYEMCNQWYVYDIANAKLADGWGAGGKSCYSKAAVMKHVRRMNEESATS